MNHSLSGLLPTLCLSPLRASSYGAGKSRLGFCICQDGDGRAGQEPEAAASGSPGSGNLSDVAMRPLPTDRWPFMQLQTFLPDCLPCLTARSS